MNKFLFGFPVVLILCFSMVLGYLAEDRGLRISGGSDSLPGSAPYNVIVLFRDTFMCCGSILSSRTILTAKQCIDVNNPSAFSIIVNTTHINAPGRLYRVDRILARPANESTSRRYDLALLYTSEDIDLSQDVQKIDINTDPLIGGLDTITRGWGVTSTNGATPDNLQEINLVTLEYEDCRKRWDGLTEVHVDEICAVARNGGGLCYGDAGGALIHNGKAIGVSSWGYGCVFGYPDVFVNVHHHSQWIIGNII